MHKNEKNKEMSKNKNVKCRNVKNEKRSIIER